MLTNYFVDPGGGSDVTGDGTIGTPWATVQHALDTITRNATDGDRVNIKAGTADVLGATLSLATYGTPTAAAPLIFQGYTATADDGGQGELDGGGAVGIWATASTGVSFVDLKLGNCGAADIIDTKDYGVCANCELHHSSGFAVDAVGPFEVVGCYIHDMTGATVIDHGPNVYGCYINVAVTTSVIMVTGNKRASGNIIYVAGADTSVNGIHLVGHGASADGNIVYSSNANTSSGIWGQYGYAVIVNNIVVGWSGAGGEGLNCDTLSYRGANAFYNNTTAQSAPAGKWDYRFADDVTLAADPFTDAANGDFSLTAAAKTALASKGWPTSYLGAHANTVSNLNIGPIQMAAGGGASIYRRVARLLGG